MPATIVVGGQYGSEGKGKVAALLATQAEDPWLVRCGGPNSGHTVRVNNTDVILRHVPCSTRPDSGMFCLAAGCVIDESTLIDELELLKIERNRIIVDPRAVMVTESDREQERRDLAGIASTCSGTGAALIRRMSRASDVRLAGNSDRLKTRCRVEPVAPTLHDALDRGERVIVEGTQGFALSLLHGDAYPYLTSRDTSASAFASEVGLSPLDIGTVVMVIRTFPIRVGGTSGPFPAEITWDTVRNISGAPKTVPEFTSVTHRLRRVAQFEIEAVVRACRYNRPTHLAVMGLDRLDYINNGVTDISALSSRASDFIREVEHRTQVRVAIVGTGFGTGDAILLPTTLLMATVAYA